MTTKLKVTSNPNPWFVCPRTNPKAEVRLFLFPYAGGGPPTFSKWLKEIPGNIEVFIAHYPGRGSRYQEPPIKSLKILVEKLAQATQPLIDKPFAFFGHSLGGLAAFELTRQLRRQNLPQPQILFISACCAPDTPDPHPSIHTLPDGEFLRAIDELNSVPFEIQNNPEIMELLLPILRADFEAFESYAYHPDDPLSLSCPIVAYGGLEDPHVSQECIESWAHHTKSSFKTQYFPGDHFFINTVRKLVIVSVMAEITSIIHKQSK